MLDRARELLDEVPVCWGNAPSAPMKGDLLSDAERTREGGGTAQGSDEGNMAHLRKLRRDGVGVKRYHALLALDSVTASSSKGAMAKTRDPKGDDELAWQQKCGKRIAWVRQVAGWSQEQMAQKLEIKQQALSSYERGIRAADPYVMLRFCARMKTTLDYVYRGTLEGTHPVLARLLLQAHPELNHRPSHTESGTDSAQAEYREAIEEH